MTNQRRIMSLISRKCPKNSTTLPYLLLFYFIVDLAAAQSEKPESIDKSESRKPPEKDFRWPDRRLNVLVDTKTINETEQQMLGALFDQIEHKSCVKINRLPQNMNPFDTKQTSQVGNFLYIFKSQFGLYNKHPSLGLSSFGCVQQGRQSLVLTELAFRWPDLVLRYHLLRTLGVDSLERPDGQVRLLLNMLPLSQKIGTNEELPLYSPFPLPFTSPSSGSSASQAQYAYSGVASLDQPKADAVSPVPVQYLSEEDLNRVKRLYQCSEYQNKLSLKPPKSEGQPASLYSSSSEPAVSPPIDSILKVIAEADQSHKVNDSSIDEAAKSIVDYLLSESDQPAASIEMGQTEPATKQQEQMDSLFPDASTPTSSCKPLESCPIDNLPAGRENKERPMLLKLDSFHASDPELRQANQMYLSQPASEPEPQGGGPSTYRLMDGPQWRQQQQQQQWQQPKSEMMISFEQVDQSSAGNPVAALAGSKVLKLCSCTCQTMRPSPDTPAQVTPPPSQQPSSSDSHLPLTSDSESTSGWSPPEQFTTPASGSSYAPTSTLAPDTSAPVTSELVTEATTTTAATTTTTSASTSASREPSGPPSEMPQPTWPSEETSSAQQSSASQETSSLTPPSQTGNLAQSAACDQVEWVRPNKTVYGSARIVWDLDRANQNYFLCNDMINGQLVPGKTHGFSCKISSEGKAYELHNFNVLTKPERVNLAWVQRNSDSFGINNLPVVGGFSKSQDPYIVSRCLVRDENNDVITLIGYVNNQGVGLFPFDDIQIECSQYDVLACVS